MESHGIPWYSMEEFAMEYWDGFPWHIFRMNLMENDKKKPMETFFHEK
jgi:hypothetical protein